MKGINVSSCRVLAAVLALGLGAVACSSDSPTAPGAAAVTPLAGPISPATSAAISSDIARSAGNAVASDIQNLSANESAAADLGFSLSAPRFDDRSGGGASGSSTPNCVESSEKGVYYCTKEPAASDHVSCKYSEEKQLFVCTRQAPPPGGGHDGANCTWSSETQQHTCTRSGQESYTIVRTISFFDADGKAMASFVKGVTASIHYVIKIDGSVSKDSTFTSVTHSLRDQVVSGFLGDTRIWNGFGSSADTNTHKGALVTRTYTGLAVDTLKAVTFAAERATNPYPLSGVAVRVMNYTVVSVGTQTETRTVSKRAVVTFNGTADVPITLGDFSCILHLDTKKVDGCKQG